MGVIAQSITLRRGRRVKKKTDNEGVKATKGQGTLLWLRMDLRLHDQPALDAAAKRASTLGGPLSFCFLQSRDEDGEDLHKGQLPSYKNLLLSKEPCPSVYH